MRIFLLGDSFTDNTYRSWMTRDDRREIVNKSVVEKYVDLVVDSNLPPPLHFEDHLRAMGHEVINLGSNGCTNYSIFYNMPKLGEYKKGDRIIVNWTGLNRYNWLGKRGNLISINGGLPDDYETNPKTKVLFDQYLLRMENSKGEGYLLGVEAPFMSYLLDLHAMYKPIMWIPTDFPNKFFKDQRFYTYEPSNPCFEGIIPEFDKLTIRGETGMNDGHYGRWGNFYAALIFNTILEYTDGMTHDGYYTKDGILFERITQAIENADSGIKPIPKRWI